MSQAYVAVHYDELNGRQTQDPTKVAKAQLGQSLGHIGSVPGGGAPAPTSATSITQTDIDAVKRFMPSATQEQMPKPESTDDILASIINPPEIKK